MSTEKVKAVLKELANERRSLLNMMDAYDSATSDENRNLAISGILNNLIVIKNIGEQFRDAVFEGRTLGEVTA